MITHIRHLKVFDPEVFGDKRVDVIGVGATGSRIALSLAKLGIKNLHLWDDDIVEEHNIANQVYGLPHIGTPKVEAIKKIISEQTGLEVNIHNERVKGGTFLGDIVFLLVDSMSARKEIFEPLIMKLNTKLIVETRMGEMEGRVYSINPCNPIHIDFWQDNWYPDNDEVQNTCRTSISVGPTAEIISGLAVSQLIKWYHKVDQIQDVEVETEILFTVEPIQFLVQTPE